MTLPSPVGLTMFDVMNSRIVGTVLRQRNVT